MSNRNFGRTICWSLLAGAAGATVALLLAPQSGRRTRRDLRKFKGHMVDRLGDFQEDFRDRVVEFVDDLEDKVSVAKTKGARVGEELMRPLHASKEMLDRQIHRAERFFEKRTENRVN